jgi:hypothetical protein
MTVVLWDSGFGKLAAFDNNFEATTTAFWEEEALFVFATIVVQVIGLGLMLTDRWMWLGTIALAGLAVLTVPGSKTWISMDEGAWNVWAAAEHLSAFAIFILAVILSSLIRNGMKLPDQLVQMPELSWRQMVLAEEFGSHSGRHVRRHSQRVFDRFYANLTKSP